MTITDKQIEIISSYAMPEENDTIHYDAIKAVPVGVDPIAASTKYQSYLSEINPGAEVEVRQRFVPVLIPVFKQGT